MNHYELIAQCSEHLPKDLLSALVKALTKKSKQPVIATADEEARFEELWSLRKEFPARNGGDPKKTALEKFCVRIREKNATQEYIKFGIRCEYSKSVKDLAHICQFETFMSQRRWESYNYSPPLQDIYATPKPVTNYRPKFLQVYEGKAS